MRSTRNASSSRHSSPSHSSTTGIFMAFDFEMSFSLRLRRDEGDQLGQAFAHAVGRNAELFDGQTETVDPESCVSEPLGAGHVPTAESRKCDFLELQAESSDP